MSFKEACQKFDEFKKDDMAIVDEGIFVGILSKEQLSGQENNSESITSLKDAFRTISVDESEKMIVALKKMAFEGLLSLPVIDSDGLMIGELLSSDLWNEFSLKSNFLGDGGWVILNMKRLDFKFSEIASIVESNGMIMVMHFVQFHEGIDMIDVHIKVDRENVNELVQTFQRYEYKITDVIQPRKFIDDWDNRFDELMRFFST